jgi:hypothetical protein
MTDSLAVLEISRPLHPIYMMMHDMIDEFQ